MKDLQQQSYNLAKQKQQRLREWILEQKYFALTPQFDGMTAWELSGIILKKVEEIEQGIIGFDAEKQHRNWQTKPNNMQQDVLRN